jgi:drug/metabolite transporter (DMT)-like permease
MAIGMLVTALPALWLKQGSLAIPIKSLPLGAPIGLMMALGSILYVLALSKLPVGMAAAISTGYVVFVMLLSRVFLDESLSWIKVVRISLTIIGVSLLSSVMNTNQTKPDLTHQAFLWQSAESDLD